MERSELNNYHGITFIAGKEHLITRVTCKKCNTILSEEHFGCCKEGWWNTKCKCRMGNGRDKEIK